MPINTTLATFMKIAITAAVISAFVFGGLYLLVWGFSNDIADYISHSN